MSIPASPGSSFPPAIDWWMSMRISSGVSESSRSEPPRWPSSLRIAFDVALRSPMKGRNSPAKNSSGLATARAIGSAFWIA